MTCTAFNKSTNHSSSDFHVKEYDGIVCFYQFHTIQNSYKTTTLHLCADTLNISNINKPIVDMMVCVLTSSVVVDRWPNHKL